jgi:hypothetical protein
MASDPVWRPRQTGYNPDMAALTDALHLMRPRTIAQISRTAEEAAQQTKEIRSTLKALSKDTSTGLTRSQNLERALEDLSMQIRTMQESLTGQIKVLADELQVARLKESQLRAVMQRDLQLESQEGELEERLKDFEGVERHVRQAFAGIEVHQEPFPYAVLDNVLPQWLYDALLTGLPPTELYGDRDVNRQQLTVPFDLAPRYGYRVWEFMAQTVADHIMRPLVIEAFGPSLHAYIHEVFPAVDLDTIRKLPIKSSDGRIMYRKRGYYIRPHRDPNWGMITCIFYLARPGDDPRWGTDLFTVDDDVPAPSVTPYWIKEERCHHVRLVENIPNRLLIFLNSKGAHGARIPEGLADAEMDRSIYQFKLSPRTAGMKMMIATLPEEQQKAWQGKITNY